MKLVRQLVKQALCALIFVMGVDSSWAVVATMIRKAKNSVQISINDVNVTEGGNLVFTVSSSANVGSAVNFNWATSNGSATAGTHYTAGSGTGTINIGTASTTVTVNTLVVAPACDPDRTVTVTLSSPVNATISDGTGVGTIKGQVPTLSIANDTQTEGTDLSFVVSISAACASNVTFNYSTVDGTAHAGSDYSVTSGTGTITAGLTTTTILVPTIDDSQKEVSETVFLTVYNVTSASSAIAAFGQGTINDNEAGANTLVKVAATTDYTCALSSAGQVKCWGNDQVGHLGQTGTHLGDEARDVGDNLPFVNLGTGVLATKLVRGKHHVCALTTTNQVKCWGGWGLLLGIEESEGRGSAIGDMGDNLPYLDFGAGLTVKDIAASASHNCVILNNDRVKCWGDYRLLGLELTNYWDSRGDDPGEMGDNLPYVNLGTGLTARKIAASNDMTCVIVEDAANTNDGKVKCWGWAGWDNANLGIGEAGIRGDAPGEMGDNLPFVNLGTGLTATNIYVGVAGVCVVLNDVANTNTGKVKCWGNNYYGALGIGTNLTYGDDLSDMGDNLPVLNLGTNYQVTDISVGGSNTCFVLGTGSLKCVGWDGYNALGYGGGCNNNTDGFCGNEAAEMGDDLSALPFGGNVVTNVSYSSSHGCVVLGTGEVACWGLIQDNGDMGANILTTDNQWGVPADLGTGVLAFSLAKGSSNDAGEGSQVPECALMTTGKVKCWGESFNGRMGLAHENTGDQANEMGANLPPINLGTGRTALDISVGPYSACALLDNHQIKCWGDGAPAGDRSTIGDQPNEMGDNLVAIDLGTGRTAVAVATMSGTTCAITDQFTLKCWGWGWMPAHGHGNQVNYGEQGSLGDNLPITDLGTGRKVLGISSSAAPCAILDNMKVKCWGYAGSGRLGNGDPNADAGGGLNEMGDNLPYLDLGTGLTVASVVGGNRYSCAMFTNGKVKCWGSGSAGQIANGDAWENWGDDPNEMGDNLPFVNLGTGRAAKAIFAGSEAETTCAILDNNSLKCWGNNAYGQLGIGDGSHRGDNPNEMGDSLPAISLGTGLIPSQVSTSSQHTCALMTNGTLKCWGRNKHGELGIGDNLNRGDNPGEMGDSLPAVDFNP